MSQVSNLSSPYAAGVAGLCLALTRVLPSKPIPSSLVGLAVASAVGSVLGLDGLAAANPAAFEGGLAALPTPPARSSPASSRPQTPQHRRLPRRGRARLDRRPWRHWRQPRAEELCTAARMRNVALGSTGDGTLDVPSVNHLALSRRRPGRSIRGGDRRLRWMRRGVQTVLKLRRRRGPPARWPLLHARESREHRGVQGPRR